MNSNFVELRDSDELIASQLPIGSAPEDETGMCIACYVVGSVVDSVVVLLYIGTRVETTKRQHKTVEQSTHPAAKCAASRLSGTLEVCLMLPPQTAPESSHVPGIYGSKSGAYPERFCNSLWAEGLLR